MRIFFLIIVSAALLSAADPQAKKKAAAPAAVKTIKPLEIPAGAVVVPGARQVSGGWGAEQGLSLQTPIIVKYRDERTDLATALEGWLR